MYFTTTSDLLRRILPLLCRNWRVGFVIPVKALPPWSPGEGIKQ
jgi:hypothetical protein